MTLVKRGLFRVVHRYRNCMLCGLVVCFTYFWVTAQFEPAVEDLTTPSPIDIHWKIANNNVRKNKRIAAIGGYGTFAANTATMMRLNSYHMLHVSPDGATISKSDYAGLASCLNKTRGQTACEEVVTISNFLLCYGVNEVNFFYSDDDFTPFHSSRHIGATLCSYVAVLQATVGKNIALKLFLQDSRTAPRMGITWQDIRSDNMMKDFKIVQYGSEKHQSNCNGEQLEIKLHDVLFHSLRSYLEMYRKLYNLQVTVFVN